MQCHPIACRIILQRAFESVGYTALKTPEEAIRSVDRKIVWIRLPVIAEFLLRSNSIGPGQMRSHCGTHLKHGGKFAWIPEMEMKHSIICICFPKYMNFIGEGSRWPCSRLLHRYHLLYWRCGLIVWIPPVVRRSVSNRARKRNQCMIRGLKIES